MERRGPRLLDGQAHELESGRRPAVGGLAGELRAGRARSSVLYSLSAGGSLTSSRPPSWRNGRRTSAVTAAARTPGRPPRRSAPAGPRSRPADSARARTTCTRPPRPSSRRRRLEERGASGRGVEQDQLGVRPGVGQDQAGHPAAAAQVEDPAGADAAGPTGPAANPSAWSTWTRTEPGPRNPRLRLRARTLSMAADSAGVTSPPTGRRTGGSRRADDHPTGGVLALGHRHDARRCR